MASRISRTIACYLAVSSMPVLMSEAHAQSVQIFSLVDASFNNISSVTTNYTTSQTVCIYSPLLRDYTIKATGLSSGGPFTISNGSSQLAYTVQWSFSAGQNTGTQLISGVGLRGTPGISLLCGGLTGLLASNASLIITLPAANLSAARAGSYSGTLSLMVSPN